MQFDTKIAVVLRDDLATWQRLNVTAFLVSGVAAADGAVGAPYEDADGRGYLPMFRQPVMVYEAGGPGLRAVLDRAHAREVVPALFTQELFATSHDDANRAAVRAVATADLALVGLAFRAPRRDADRLLKGVALHR